MIGQFSGPYFTARPLPFEPRDLQVTPMAFSAQIYACVLRAWAINSSGKNSFRNLQYRPRTRLLYTVVLVIWRVLPIGDVPYINVGGNNHREENTVWISFHFLCAQSSKVYYIFFIADVWRCSGVFLLSGRVNYKQLLQVNLQYDYVMTI